MTEIQDIIESASDELSRIDDFDHRISAFETRLEEMDERIETFDERLSEYEDRLDAFEGRIDYAETVDERLDEYESKLAELEDMDLGGGESPIIVVDDPSEIPDGLEETNLVAVRNTELDPIDLPSSGHDQTGHTNYCGVVIVPDKDLKGVEVRLGGDERRGRYNRVSHIYIYDDAQNRLEELEFSDSAEPGDLVEIEHDLVEGQEYKVLLNDGGSEYVRYRAEADYTYGGDGLTVVEGAFSPGSRTSSYVYNIDQIRALV